MLAALCVALLSAMAVTANPPSAHADPTVATIPWPTNMGIAPIYAHGNNSLTAMYGNDCARVSLTDTTSSTVTYTADYATSYSQPKNGSDGWETTDCSPQETVGSDNTIYVVQQNTSSNSMQQRLVAINDNTVLWEQSFYGACPGFGQISSPTMGFDGNVYLIVNCSTLSASVWRLAGVNAATGATVLWEQLPSNFSGIVADDIMPYENGIAVANSQTSIYYYSYTGVADTADTFTPPNPSGLSVIVGASTSATGRTYVGTQEYTNIGGVWQFVRHVYYKDTGDPTIYQVSAPSGATLASSVQVTPAGGLVVGLTRSTGYTYFGYFDSSGTETYEVNLSNDSGGSVPSGSPVHWAVDSLGNVIVERAISLNASPHDTELYIDSYDSTGNKTRLFDSEAQFGTSGLDVFGGSLIPQSLGDGKLYLALCHQTSGTSCTSTATREIVVVPMPGSFDYPRSAAFAAQAGKPNYVALGDSYSSGEGNPPFIAPSDTDGCDRSPQAYAPLVALAANVSLRAFVACSGATSDEEYTGMDGEPSQLDLLDASTNLVTLTSGGDDAGFPAFAEACVNPATNCGTDSSAYTTAMDYIDNSLQDNLELLYNRIHAAAPNATVYVVGYPQVAPEPGGTCTFFTDSEKTAARNLVTALNAKALAAVQDLQNTDADFEFVDPTQTGSPFIGHELCTDNSYFNDVEWPTNYSFHPNADGQAAYAQLIADNVTSS